MVSSGEYRSKSAAGIEQKRHQCILGCKDRRWQAFNRGD